MSKRRIEGNRAYKVKYDKCCMHSNMKTTIEEMQKYKKDRRVKKYGNVN